MSMRVRVPIRVRPAFVSERAPSTGVPEVANGVPWVMDPEVVAQEPPSVAPARPKEVKRQDARRKTAAGTREPGEVGESLEIWRDRALRLQAEMENFCKRQQRLTDERVAADRKRLLRAFLNVNDDLERALNAGGTDAESLRQGVNLTHQTMARLLEQEGAELIQAGGRPFDPVWHEAVGTVPHQQADAEPDTVIKVVQAGYRLGGCLLRPARVVVAT